jgi:hypothetical protein
MATCHHRHAERAAEVAQRLADQLIEFVFVDHLFHRTNWQTTSTPNAKKTRHRARPMTGVRIIVSTRRKPR